MDKFKYKVCVQCITYNHAPYIKESLNGFVSQQTTFPYVITIIDDNSTDGNQSVILQFYKEEFRYEEKTIAFQLETDYANIYYARHNKNINCYFVILLLKFNHHSKGLNERKVNYISEWCDSSEYLAICEGDDFWVDPLKLQKQVDFLDNNLDYSVCCTDFNLVSGNRNHKVSIPDDGVCFPLSIAHELEIGTATALYRSSIFKKLPQLWKGKNWMMEDTPMWIELSKEGKIKYLKDVTAHYRVLESSASHGEINKELAFLENSLEIHRFYADFYGVVLENEGYNEDYYLAVSKIAFKHKDKKTAYNNYRLAKNNGYFTAKIFVLFLFTTIPLLGWIFRKCFNYKT